VRKRVVSITFFFFSFIKMRKQCLKFRSLIIAVYFMYCKGGSEFLGLKSTM
jgi:hypothetical protein